MQLAFRAANLQFVILVHNRNACGIIAAIFKLSQALDDQRHDLFVADVSDYSTHISQRLAVSSEQKAVGRIQ
jgi:hypothetical protein